MQILNIPRMGGKTTMLVNWVKEKPNRVLAVNSYERKRQVMDQFKLSIDQVIVSADHGHSKLRGQGPVEIAVDEAEQLLEELLAKYFDGNEVKVFSGSMQGFNSGNVQKIGLITTAKTALEEFAFNTLAQKYGMLTEDQVLSMLGIRSLDSVLTTKIVPFIFQGQKYYPGLEFKKINEHSSKYVPNFVFTVTLEVFHRYSTDNNELFTYLSVSDLDLLEADPLTYIENMEEIFKNKYKP